MKKCMEIINANGGWDRTPEEGANTNPVLVDEFLKGCRDAGIVVNMPVAKHHGGAGLTIAMKNWMGAVDDRKFRHKNDLHQCIADIATFIKPNWTIIDATRTMYDKGPQGPANELKIQNILIVSKDQVAADAYAAKTLFPEAIYEKAKYIRIASEMGLGIIDVEKMNVRKFEV